MSQDSIQGQYLHVQVHNVPSHLEDFLTSLCFDFGASGVSEDLSFTQEDRRYLPELQIKEFHTLNVFFEKWPEEDFFQALQSLCNEIQIDRRLEANKDWMEEWKKGFEAFPLVESTWIVPSWKERPVQARQAIFIDPGMAFGTGTHATTQLAAQMLSAHRTTLAEARTAIDVGTGTGVLAILLDQFGVDRTLATEIDVDAREVAKENIRKNQCRAVVVLDEQIDSVKESFDVVVANIIDGILLDIKPDLLRCLKPGGLLFLTGILKERRGDFRTEFFSDQPGQILDCLEKEEWVGFCYRGGR